ncbi:hypothetical protein LTR99_011289, partial [Exophiala xenobiotica]
CHVDVSRPLTTHDDGIVREDGIQQREVAAALGPGQPVSIYPKALSSQDLAQSKEPPSSFDSSRNKRRKRYTEEVEE